MKPKRYQIAITHRCYDGIDVRKRASSLLDALDGVNPVFFAFWIMGAGWDGIVEKLRERGFPVNYDADFQREKYIRAMSEMDYFLYMGFDEGTMGYLDALAAGIGTIVTPQGYHLDSHCPIDYPCRTVFDFNQAFLTLQHKREEKIKSIEDWTWENYAKKHLQIWNYLLRRKTISELYQEHMHYEDGIYSLTLDDNRI